MITLPSARALANVLANTFGGNGLNTHQQVELATEQIEEWYRDRRNNGYDHFLAAMEPTPDKERDGPDHR